MGVFLAIHVLVVEDDAGAARLIARMLPSDFVAQRAATKRAALRALRDPSRIYRLALIDVALGLERTAGLEVLDLATAQRPALVRALVTASSDRKITNRAVTCGAYLVGKPFEKEQLAPLLEAARAIAGPLNAALARCTIDWKLTARHEQIVRLLVAGQPREEIPSALGISENTFRAHVRELLRRSGELKVDGVIIAFFKLALAERLAG